MPAEVESLQKPSRKGREREGFASEFQDKMIALQRRSHAPITRPRDRTERVLPPISTAVTSRSPPAPSSSPARKPTPQQPIPQVVIYPSDAPIDDFSRRLQISSSPRAHPAKAQNKLFNPSTDPIPMRRTQEPDAMSESTGSSYARAHAKPAPSQHTPRQLFDYRRDDPVRFSAQSRKPPTPKSSGDYISSSSSYAQSIASSSFTLSSTTDGSSAPSSIFDGKAPREESKSSAFSAQLKKLYHNIVTLEARILREDSDESGEESRVVLRSGPEATSEDAEKAKWQKMINDHKSLADMMHNLLEIATAQNVPASLRNIPDKYSIIIRLWSYGFHRLLESLRRSALHSTVALEYLQDFIYYAYTFYTGLYEESNLSGFKAGWLEALGDLARYRMAVAAMIPETILPSNLLSVTSNGGLTPYPLMTPTSTMGNASDGSDRQMARIDDSPSPSVGIVAARNFDLEPEKERWRIIAREWYGAGVSDTPGNGKLHHHLGLLSRETDNEELRGVYHFTKSMIATHPFGTSRESVLAMWAPAAQARRMQPESTASELFVLLHGMLFTNIQLDDFRPTMARLLERLSIDAPEGREWTMMACVNVAAILEYGKATGVMRREGALGVTERGQAAAAAKVKLARKDKDTDGMDIDGDGPRKSSESEQSPATSEASASDAHPPAFTMALELAFAMLAHALDHFDSHVGLSGRPTPSAYLTVMLTFLATVLKNAPALGLLERSVPWAKLAALLVRAPRRLLEHEDGTSDKLSKRGALPEDWCVRGMAWPGRGLFERGFWKADESTVSGSGAPMGIPTAGGGSGTPVVIPTAGSVGMGREMEVLDERDAARSMDVDEGEWEKEGEDAGEHVDVLRWKRVVWAGARLARLVPGFSWRSGREWAVVGVLAEKVEFWAEEARLAREEEERRRMRTRWSGDDLMDIDEDGAIIGEQSSSDDEEDSEEVRELKARRRYLRNLLQASQRGAPGRPLSQPEVAPPRRKRPRESAVPVRPSLKLVPGYTILVLDTNILLSSLSMVASLVESGHWTVVVPLPVIMELDGLGANVTPLGDAAKASIAFLTSHIRTHTTSLKVLTSRGNYLHSLSVRTEAVDFAHDGAGGAWERNMDDLILRATIWQDEHWLDRSHLLGGDGERGRERDTQGAVKVVLLSLDRNLRLKARARQLSAASEVDLAFLLTAGSS